VHPPNTTAAPTPLRIALEKAGVSQRGLARILRCDRKQVGAWVSGEHVPVPSRQAEIARAVKAPVEELWPDADRKAA
jgi:transcriptional regulator with XRE-family HTH domain